MKTDCGPELPPMSSGQGVTACQDFLLDKQDKKKQETSSYPLSELENVSKLFINNRKNQRNASKKRNKKTKTTESNCDKKLEQEQPEKRQYHPKFNGLP